MRRKSARYFILLEILIAFFLVALCVFPLIQPHISILKSEKILHQKLKDNRLSNAYFCTLVEKFYRNEVPLNDLYSEKPIPLRKYNIDAEGTVLLSIPKRKESDDQSYYIVKASIRLANGSPHHGYLFVEKKGKITQV